MGAQHDQISSYVGSEKSVQTEESDHVGGSRNHAQQKQKHANRIQIG
jgi:hypothetical protein